MAYERVNPSHPDKIADRISGAIVDLCYTKSKNPKVACEVLIGHGECNIQVETSEQISSEDIESIVRRIAGEGIETRALIVPQDIHLAANQQHGVKCGDNGIFRGVPPTHEQKLLTAIAASIYERHPSDGKYIIQGKGRLAAPEFDVTICQSHLSREQEPELREHLKNAYGIHLTTINPLGEWTGGPMTDTGATNRKLGSDMGDAVTGGGLHGKDLSKADVSVNIVCHLLALRHSCPVTATCAIGDKEVTFHIGGNPKQPFPANLPTSPDKTLSYRDIVEQARNYIHTLGGFEKFAECGLIR